MQNTFTFGQLRKITHANFNYYEQPTLHPDRIMSEHDLVYITEGAWEISQNEESFLLEKDDFIVLHAGEHHYGIKKCLPKTRTMYVHATKVNGDSYLLSSETAEHKLTLPTVIHCQDNIIPYNIMKDIITTYWLDLPQKNLKLNSLFDLLLVELSSIYNNSYLTTDVLVDRALELILTSGEKVYSLEDLSSILHVSSRLLTKRFKIATGKTIHQYQIDIKLEMAYQSIILGENRTFKEIASNHGFYDEFHFSKLFKKKYGFPPSKLKNS